MKVIITKYATSSGVTVREVKRQWSSDLTCLLELVPQPGEFGSYYVDRGQFATTKKAATRHVYTLFEKRRRSLIKALDGLSRKQDKALEAIRASDLPED